METLAEMLVFLLAIMVLLVPFLFVYKYRASIKKWIRNPYYGDMAGWEPDAIKRAERGVTKAEWRLEDAKDFLA